MSGKAWSFGLTVSQFDDGNLWHDEHSIWCAFALCGKSEYFFGAGVGRVVARRRTGVGVGTGPGVLTAAADGPKNTEPITDPLKTIITKQRAVVLRLRLEAFIFVLPGAVRASRSKYRRMSGFASDDGHSQSVRFSAKFLTLDHSNGIPSDASN